MVYFFETIALIDNIKVTKHENKDRFTKELINYLQKIQSRKRAIFPIAVLSSPADSRI